MPKDESSEVYTPSFDHKNQDFEEKSPLSLIKKKEYSPKRKGKRLKWNEDGSFAGHGMHHHDYHQHHHHPMMQYRGLSQPPPVDIRNQLGIHTGGIEEEKERAYMPPKQYYPTCNCQKTVNNMKYNPYGYYYAPANILFSPRSIDSDEHMKKRHKKRRSKTREKHRSGRAKSAYVHNKTLLQIIPTMKDNKILLHAYPIEEAPVSKDCSEKEQDSAKKTPTYIQKLEYSSGKKSSRYNRSSCKKKS